jgi:hypothetical protein
LATTYKNSQIQGTATISTYATLYSTSASVNAVISSICVTNTASSDATYRVAIMGSAGTPAAANWLVYDGVITGKDTVALTLGVTLQTSQFIRVSSSGTAVTFNAFVSEIEI